jgi:imidazolonepropionase-like amidohydrolase
VRLACSLLVLALPACAQPEVLKIHLILHEIGQEQYELTSNGDTLTLRTKLEYSDRGNQRSADAVLKMRPDFTPLNLDVKPRVSTVVVQDGSATITEGTATRSGPVPDRYFTIFGSSPFALQMAMMRYWSAHAKPASLPWLRSDPAAPPIHIELAGHVSINVSGKAVSLDRYTIANLMFGSEILWVNPKGGLAAAMTFAGGLPMEAIRAEYEPVLPQLYNSGIRQEMANLAAIERRTAPDRTGTFAIAGATLIDSTGAPPVHDSVVIVRNGRIASAGPRGTVAISAGVPVIDAKGKALLPGLWEMHTHFSGVEFGPALLAAGVTTARDCGGEFDYLVAQRDAIEKHGALSPRLLLAGLVDAGGLKAFGHVTAETPEQGRAVVQRYHAAGFQQIKLYTFLTPDVIRAIAEEAHKLGMTVTGHVPQAFNAFQGVEAGMDQINHLNYVTTMMRGAEGGRGAIDLESQTARSAIQFFKDHHTVVDPTAGWGEMASHSKDVGVASFEPGIDSAPFVLESKFRGMAGNTTADQMRARIAQTVAAIGALHKAGVAIVPGSDTGLVGYGLIRELELYVQAGMTPLEALQSATIVSARAMGLERDSGSIEPGKRADLILVDGDPSVHISDLRKISQVVANGRLYSTSSLRQSVGFRP